MLPALRRRGLRTAVVSDCWYELPELLPGLPVYPLLDARVFSVEVGRCKPHPAMYLTACERLGRARRTSACTSATAAARNSPAPRAVGMAAIRLAAPDLADHLDVPPRRRSSGARRVTSLGDLLPLLDGLLAALPMAILARDARESVPDRRILRAIGGARMTELSVVEP